MNTLSKELHDRAFKLGVKSITFSFSGGSDNGYLDVYFDVPNPYSAELSKLNSDLNEYAWEVNPYSGAGDGNDYGDDYVFDLVKNTVSHSTWYMRRVDTDEGSRRLKID